MTATPPNVINSSAYYAAGKGMPDHTFAMETLPYSVSMDNIVLLCLMLITLVLSLSLYHRRHILFFRSKTFFTSRRVFSGSSVNESKGEWLNVLLLSLAFSFSFGIIIYYCLALKYQFPDYYDKPHWIIYLGAGAVFAIIYIRAIVYSIVNWVFFAKDENHRWNVGYFLLVVVMSYFVSLLAIASVFLQLDIKTVTLCVVFLYVLYELLHLYKLFVNFKFKRYGAVLIFLYFCSVEMLPIMLIGHVLEWVFNSYFVYNLLT
ncbi:MAG: DUF4271 domain-containing protein [Bacteroidaceae bacterium]|nr:DUF4271 domain-containing protein [Bacteroidaceae bacterium]